MILLDYREESPSSRRKRELADIIRRFGVAVEITDLQFGDAAIQGYGEGRSSITVGIEMKRLHDALSCIDSGRIAGHQRIGMVHSGLYNEAYFLIEGMWRPHDPKGYLMESRDGKVWYECKPSGRPVMYDKLRRYLFSVGRAGAQVIYTRDIVHTAFDLVQLYHYYQKKDHTSMLQKQQFSIPVLTKKPPLIRRWAMEIEDVGLQKLDAVQHLFKTPQGLANSGELEWLAIPGVGLKTAQSIVAEIEGKR